MSFTFRKTGNPVALPAQEREYARVSGGARVTEVGNSVLDSRYWIFNLRLKIINDLMYRNFYNQLKTKSFFEASEFALGMEYWFFKRYNLIFNFFVKMNFAIKLSSHYPRTHYSNIPPFQLGRSPISAKLFLRRGTVESLLKQMNIEHRTSNIEWWMGKDEETEELIKIFVTSIKTAEKKKK